MEERPAEESKREALGASVLLGGPVKKHAEAVGRRS